MNNEFESKLTSIVNHWYNDLDSISESDCVNCTFSKKKFSSMYVQKTGEFLRISSSAETKYFNKIVQGLSENNIFSEELLDEYLDWCFKNYDYIIRKYKTFTLNSVAAFSKVWDKSFIIIEEIEIKKTLKDLKFINVSENVFEYCEAYGIALVSTKLSKEKNISKNILENVIISKLNTLTNKNEDLLRLKNMLRTTVENSPYSSDILFKDYKNKLKELFVYFSGEIWAK